MDADSRPPPENAPSRLVERATRRIERVVVHVLMVLMVIVAALAVLDLGWLLAHDILTPPILVLDVDQLLELFGGFLLILIGLELLESVRLYFEHRERHVEIVLEIALIALARKLILTDVTKYHGLVLLGVAGIVLALAGAYTRVRPK